jgi:hypothetical protein
MATINHRDAVLLVIAFLAARAINAMMRLGQSSTLRKLHHFERTDHSVASR